MLNRHMLENEDAEFRRAKLHELVSKAGKIVDFCRGTDIYASYISQILNGHRAFGEKAARKMEKQARLEDRYFEPDYEPVERRGYQDRKYRDAPSTQRDAVDEVADEMLRLTPKQAERIKKAIKLLTQDADADKT